MVRTYFLFVSILLLFISCQSEKEVFMFTSFKEPATDGLYLLYSRDGYNWTELKGVFLEPKVGESKLMRDPSIVQGPDGTYHLVWTTGWKGDQGFGYASSKDLVNWSEQKFINVMEFEPSTVNVWAPELFYDENTKDFIVVWASTVPYRFPRGIEDEMNNHRMYYTSTKDFVSFSKAKLFYDPGFSVIDAVIVKQDKDQYALILKDNTRPNRNLKMAFSDQALGPYSASSEAFTGTFIEGPTELKIGNEWLIYYDVYQEKRYGAMKTTDFKTFVDVSNEINVPLGHKHGTIFKATEEILQELKKVASKR